MHRLIRQVRRIMIGDGYVPRWVSYSGGYVHVGRPPVEGVK